MLRNIGDGGEAFTEREGGKDCKSLRIWEFAMGSYLLIMSEDTPMKSHQLDGPDTLVDLPKWVGEKPMRPQSYTKNYRQLRNAGSGRNSPPQGRTVDVYYPTVIPENRHIQVI